MKPEITIEYCAAWNYEPKAVGLAVKLLELKQRIGSVKLVPASGGVFEVSVDEENIHSKKATGEFPDFDVLVRAIKGRL